MGWDDDDNRPTRAECNREAHREQVEDHAREIAREDMREALQDATKEMPAEMVTPEAAAFLVARVGLLMGAPLPEDCAAFICREAAGYDPGDDWTVADHIADGDAAHECSLLFDRDYLRECGAWDAAADGIRDEYEERQFERDHAPGRV